MEMEGPPSPGETPNKKKRNPSFRRALRKQGIDVVSACVPSGLNMSNILIVSNCRDIY